MTDLSGRKRKRLRGMVMSIGFEQRNGSAVKFEGIGFTSLNFYILIYKINRIIPHSIVKIK
jgi:hypothetical protein